MNTYFRKAHPGEDQAVYTMTASRVAWMNRMGIHQWNDTDYLEVYPAEYYHRMLDRLYVLVEAETEHILCAAILLDKDDRWNTDTSAFYIHNLVSAEKPGGMGRVFIRCVERYAAEQNRQYLRLDSADNNSRLAEYYAALGFEPVGACQDGKYHGILRQKPVSAPLLQN